MRMQQILSHIPSHDSSKMMRDVIAPRLRKSIASLGAKVGQRSTGGIRIGGSYMAGMVNDMRETARANAA